MSSALEAILADVEKLVDGNLLDNRQRVCLWKPGCRNQFQSHLNRIRELFRQSGQPLPVTDIQAGDHVIYTPLSGNNEGELVCVRVLVVETILPKLNNVAAEDLTPMRRIVVRTTGEMRRTYVWRWNAAHSCADKPHVRKVLRRNRVIYRRDDWCDAIEAQSAVE